MGGPQNLADPFKGLQILTNVLFDKYLFEDRLLYSVYLI
jgi:hypothetical protein